MNESLDLRTQTVRTLETDLRSLKNQRRPSDRVEPKQLRKGDSIEVIEFKYVGRGNRSWTEKVPHPEKKSIDLDAVLKSVLAEGGFTNGEVEVDFNEEKNRGTIYTERYRPVGSFRIIQ